MPNIFKNRTKNDKYHRNIFFKNMQISYHS
jgi:hypothetical protein